MHSFATIIKRRILIVDDDIDAALMLGELVEAHGQLAKVVSNGAEALEIAKEWWPQVAILDLAMPAMDGFELAAALRVLGNHAALKVFALSGWTDAKVRQRCKDEGFDEFFAKPVSVKAIILAL